MCCFYHTSNTINLVTATKYTAFGVIENCVFVKDFVDCSATAQGSFSPNTSQITEQQGRYVIGHDLSPHFYGTSTIWVDRLRCKTTSASREICPKPSRTPLALTFPDTSLFIKVVKRLERKIDERLRSPMNRKATNR
jgi:hypothetical protein